MNASSYPEMKYGETTLTFNFILCSTFGQGKNEHKYK